MKKCPVCGTTKVKLYPNGMKCLMCPFEQRPGMGPGFMPASEIMVSR